MGGDPGREDSEHCMFAYEFSSEGDRFSYFEEKMNNVSS